MVESATNFKKTKMQLTHGEAKRLHWLKQILVSLVNNSQMVPTDEHIQTKLFGHQSHHSSRDFYGASSNLSRGSF